VISISENAIQTFVGAIKMHGEKAVTTLLSSMRVKDKSLKNYIINCVCNEYEATWETIISSQNMTNAKCLTAYLLKKYTNEPAIDIAIDVRLSYKTSVYKYFKYIESLNPCIKQENDLIIKLQNIESKIDNFLINR
jgi:hypothetical protein